MNRQLIVTPKARQNAQNIAIYISRKFGDERAEQYLKEINEQLQIICQNPQRYPSDLIKNLSFRICVFKKKTIIQFVFTDKEVKIISILDARSNWRP